MQDLEKGKRTADEGIYLKEDRYEKPKEIFKLLAEKMRPHISEGSSLLDVGSATGELIFYIIKLFPGIKCTGIDVSDKMIAQAKEKLPGQEFECKDILTKQVEAGKKYDIVNCLGVLSIFDDIETPIQNLLAHTKEEGTLFLGGVFNPNQVDVVMRYREAGKGQEEWELGWNLYSKETYEKILKKAGVKEWKWHEFKMPFALPKQEDAMRSWTIKTEENPFQLVNGAMQMLDMNVLEVSVGKE